MEGALPRRKRALFAAVTAAVGLGGALLVAELGLRLHERRARPRRPAAELDLLRANPRGSFRLHPHLDLVAEVGRRRIAIRTNSHGMRWREVSKRKDGRRRVAFLGDSFTFGCWARSVEHSLVGVFESNVSPTRWEVLNFGVGGYGLKDVELLIEEQVLEFGPDFVVVVFFAGNDFRDTYLGLHKDRIVNGTAVLDTELLARKVPEEFRGRDRTTSQPSRERASLPALLRRLALFRFVAPWLSLERLEVDFRVNRRFIAYSFWSQVPYPPVALSAKDESLATLLRIRSLLAGHDVQLGIVALPTREQVYARAGYGPGFDVSFPQAYVQVLAREQAIPYLDLLPVFREHVAGSNENLYVHGDTHLNDAGHRLAGWHVSEWFRCCLKSAGRQPPR